jgi:AraC family transcriptional regulator of adaptative response/methylated-DNA-[protein]-cysteine methyltransferase
MTPHISYQTIARALRFIEAHAERQPSLAAVAAHVRLSESHTHRLFRQWVGITPKDFLQVLTLAKAKRLLQSADSVLDTSFTIGLSGSGRLHDLFVRYEGMTPGEYKRGAAGLTIRWGTGVTPFGVLLLAMTEQGICASYFADTGIVAAVEQLRARWPGANFIRDSAAVAPWIDEVNVRMRGQATRPLALLLRGSPFQVKIWEALLSIPEGAVVSYQQVAQYAGTPSAVRAVGSAIAANQIGYLIPCHRVIRATGAIGEYRWGVERKATLISVEGARRRDTHQLAGRTGRAVCRLECPQ